MWLLRTQGRDFLRLHTIVGHDADRPAAFLFLRLFARLDLLLRWFRCLRHGYPFILLFQTTELAFKVFVYFLHLEHLLLVLGRHFLHGILHLLVLDLS